MQHSRRRLSSFMTALGSAMAALVLLPAAIGATVSLVATEHRIVDWTLRHRPDGSFTLGWVEALDNATRDSATWLRHFDTSGAPLGPAMAVAQPPDIYGIDFAADGLGNELAVLQARIPSGPLNFHDEVRAVALSATGSELWPAVLLAVTTEQWDFVADVDVVPAPGGGWIVVWLEYHHQGLPQWHVKSRFVALATGEATPPVEVAGAGGLMREQLALATDGAQTVAVWREQEAGPNEARLVSRTLNGVGVPNASLVDLAVLGGVEPPVTSLDIDSWGVGQFFLTWSEFVGAGDVQVRGVAYSPGAPTEAPVELARHPGYLSQYGSTVAVDHRGRALVAWYETPVDASVPSAMMRQERLVTGSPLSEPAPIATLDTDVRGFTSSITPGGSWAIAWPKTGLFFPFDVIGIDAELGQTHGGCEPSDEALCLSSGRFLATATFHDHLGRDGVGQAVALTPESGTFWFFTPANVELVVKVVDACGHPDFRDFWVYASGLTDVEVTLTVVDTWTGEVWERETDLGEPFPPILDSQAFHTCDAVPLTGSRIRAYIGR